MNEFISPHQNININISYNLGQQQKMPKVVFGKKIAKIVKSSVKDNSDVLYKTFKKNSEHVIPVQELKKVSNQKNKIKKKKQPNLLTIPDQDMPQPRRLKTQGNLKSEALNSMTKKQSKNNSKTLFKGNAQHSKSVNNPPVTQNIKTQQIKRPATSSNKIKRQDRRNYNKSCILYQPKKNLLLSDIQHIVSTTTTGPTPTNKQTHKKRVNSVNVMRTDKFINKLLDMSVLTSELGGSIPMHDQNCRNHQNTNNRIKNSLQEFMNSIDLKIIKKMEQDHKGKKNILIDAHLGQGIDFITYLNKIRRIPMQKLHEKAKKIQRFWRKKTTENIIPYYSNMFFRNPAINSKAAIQNNLNQISDIDIRGAQGQYQEDQHDSLIRSSKDIPKVNRQIFQFVSVVKVSSSEKQQFEEESISITKINKILEYGSAVRQPTYEKKELDFEHAEEYVDGQGEEGDEQDEESGSQHQQYIQFEHEVVKKQYSQQGEEQEFSQGKQGEGEEENEEEGKSLNIQKYKQLVRESIQKNKKQAQKQKQLKNLRLLDMPKQVVPKTDEANEQQQLKNGSRAQGLGTQSAHWNHVHNILSSNMNKKAPLMSRTVLEQLMKQSAYNKQWVQGQFSNSQSRKMSQISSPRQHKVQIHQHGHGYGYEHEHEQQQMIQHMKNKQKSKKKIQKILAQELQCLNKQQYKFTSKSSRQGNQQGDSKVEQEQDNDKQQYNWNKYSDISKLKKPQEIITKNKDNQDKEKHNRERDRDNQIDIINMKVANLEQIERMIGKGQLCDAQFNINHNANYNVDANVGVDADRQQNNGMSGLLPTGIKNNSLYSQEQSSQYEQKLDNNRHQAVNALHNNAGNMDDSIDGNTIGNEEKDQKWIREQMIMEDGIVEKYLDCGLDNFGLNFNKRDDGGKNRLAQIEQKHNNSIKPKPIEQIQQQEVQQREEHKAKLQKQPHRHQSQPLQQPKPKTHQNRKQPSLAAKQTQNKKHEHSNDDIFSSDDERAVHHDDQQLVYVFNNINHKDPSSFNRDVALEHAVKNSKRKDNQYHLGYRPEDLSIINQFVNADYSINKLREQKQEQIKSYKQYSPGSQESLQKQSQKIPLFQLFQPSFKNQPIPQEQGDFSAQQLAIKQQINTKRVQKITQTIIAKLIQQFALDVSVILRKTQQTGNGMMQPRSHENNRRSLNGNQLKPAQSVSPQASLSTSSTNMGILTNFQNIREFITKLKQYILISQEHAKKVIQNLRNNIGPTSMQILSYLRIEQPNQYLQQSAHGEQSTTAQQQQRQLLQQQEDNQQWLFVIPNDLFEVFNKRLIDEQEQKRGKKLSNRFKLYTQFWHRSIFECYNECLDFERPYGITGAPYTWITQAKLPHDIRYSKKKVEQILQNAQNRLLQLSCSSSGIIFDKPQSPYKQFQLNQQQRIQLNEQKISRMLANQILDDQYNWITYNDQMTELMVDISRKIEELLLFQLSTDIKKIMRRRKMMVHVGRAIKNERNDKSDLDIDIDASSDEESQHVVFMVEDLA